MGKNIKIHYTLDVKQFPRLCLQVLINNSLFKMAKCLMRAEHRIIPRVTCLCSHPTTGYSSLYTYSPAVSIRNPQDYGSMKAFTVPPVFCRNCTGQTWNSGLLLSYDQHWITCLLYFKAFSMVEVVPLFLPVSTTYSVSDMAAIRRFLIGNL